MELAGDRSDPLEQRRLDVHVDVFEARVPYDRACLDIPRQPLKALDEHRDLVVGEDAGPAEPANVSNGLQEIVEGELRVDLGRPREVGDARVVLLAEPAAPEPHRSSSYLAPPWYVPTRVSRIGPSAAAAPQTR